VLYNTARVAVQSFCLRSRLLQSILHLHAAAPPLLAPRPCGSLICKRVAQQVLFTPVGLLLLQKLQSTRFIHPGRIAAKTPKHSIKKKRSGITGGALNAVGWLLFSPLDEREQRARGKFIIWCVYECVCCAQGVTE
jgi:hypothetical protein